MKINKQRDGEKLTIALEGRLDTVTAKDLADDVKDSLNGITDLTFDLAELSYVSSAGLRVLLMAQKTMADQGHMRVINVTEPIEQILEVTGFTTLINIE
ncbi:MAG: STAS domain-containing protein [Lachnospiraceae bacterium]|nr:STAS domain-containing protein [Lachnospiraceae bacterium]